MEAFAFSGRFFFTQEGEVKNEILQILRSGNAGSCRVLPKLRKAGRDSGQFRTAESGL